MLATANLVVSGDDNLGTGVVDTVTQALCRETTKHHGVCCADTGASLHGSHAVDRHGNVDDHTVTLLHALGLQRIGDLAGLGQQIRVGNFGDFATVSFKNDGCFVAQAFFDVAVEAVVGRVQRAVCKPLEERCVAFVESLCKGGLPADQLTGVTSPKAFVIGLSFFAQRIVGSHASHSCVFDEFFAGLVDGQYACTFISTHVVSWTIGVK